MMENQPTIEQHNSTSQCLYLSSSGERCTRPAYEDGFCDRHGKSTTWLSGNQMPRKLAALLIGLAVIWPILQDLWNAVRHLFH
ncbi:MAG TPA: DUF5763 domain-containing protein [Candidatus Acidoferrales bacterium]|nr:DUF5763 domain-containing protein [Candidatus Acidoferrales bacterium]